MATFVYCPDHPEASEWGHVEKWKAQRWFAEHNPPTKRSNMPCPRYMSDITPFVSPITREVISSRSQLARHNRANGVRQCGDVSTQALIEYIDKQHAEASAPQEGVDFSWTKFEM